jgi:hypothetical protein
MIFCFSLFILGARYFKKPGESIAPEAPQAKKPIPFFGIGIFETVHFSAPCCKVATI